LLKMITGVLTPSTGSIEINGTISSLLELGAGFNPELSGIENIYLNGTMLGFSRADMNQKLNDILSFADIGDFVNQPMKTYSSGMYVRLAFAAAISVDPDILIVDEALAVGDIAFQSKCFRKFKSLKDAGKTIILVTHSMDMVTRHCDRAILIQEGKMLEDGAPNDVVNMYTKLMTSRNKTKMDEVVEEKTNVHIESNLDAENDLDIKKFAKDPIGYFQFRKGYNPNEFRWGDKRGEIIDYLLVVDGRLEPAYIYSGQKVELYVKYHFNQEIENLIAGLIIKSVDGVVVFGQNTSHFGVEINTSNSICVIKFSLVNRLNTGKYLISVGCSDGLYDEEHKTLAVDRRNDSIILEVSNKITHAGLIDPELIIEQIHPK
jgi:lipopolysaccharide transport system ATP-binding protein